MHPQKELGRIFYRDIEAGGGSSEKAGKIKTIKGDPWKEVGSRKVEEYDENDGANVIRGPGNGGGGS